MCTYNGARFIEEQLWSIFRQTLLPREIVVSDDNSSDETLLLIEKTYLEASSSIGGVSEIEFRIVRNTSSLGVTKNFEQAISLCSYELIALCDQDDVWVVQRLEKMVGEFKRRPDLSLLHHDSDLVDENTVSLGTSTFNALRISSKEKQLIHNGFANKVLLKRNVVTGATVLLRREIFELSSPFPEGWIHDEWLAIIASFTSNIDFLDEKLIYYRQHLTNQIGVSKPKLKHLIGRIFYPRNIRNKILLTRAGELRDKFHDSNNLLTRELVSDKFVHETTRSDYPYSRIRRVIPVAREISTGRYFKFGLGLQDILRDLLQSPK